MPLLFDELTLRSVTLTHRLLLSPMCQYSALQGCATDWHFAHLACRAVGGAALVLAEASAVTPDGRITPHDLGIYDDRHIDGLARIVRFVHEQRALAGIQLAHAGRKGSTGRLWEHPAAIPIGTGGWPVVSSVGEPFAPGYAVPRALSTREIREVVEAFARAARRAVDAGFDIIELHAAHGYLIGQFLSPLVNTRTDVYGGSFDNRVRFCLEIAEAVRRVWPDRLPLFVRISCTDWKEGGWDVEQSIELAKRLRDRGVDLIDCSSGGAVPGVQIQVAPGFQVPFAERIRREADVATGAVGLITSAEQANEIVRSGRADCVFVAREMLRDPYFALHAAQQLGHKLPWPAQYLRAAPDGAPARL
jgi:2,4-dienoyl-CoA reductase-like NADH-dependent reductase (Old Yellow Enzyme family)